MQSSAVVATAKCHEQKPYARAFGPPHASAATAEPENMVPALRRTPDGPQRRWVVVSAKSVSQYRALPKSKETAAAKSTATFFLFGAEYMGVVPLAIVVCLFCAKVAVGADFRGTGSDLMWTLVLSEMERVVGGREGAFRATYDRVLERTAGNAGAAETIKAFFGFQYRNLLSAVVANNKHVGGDGPPTADPSEISNFALKLPPISRFEPLGEDERFGAFSEECGALADLYRATDGPHWLVQRGWNDAAQLRNNCCAAFGVTCNRDGHVEQLTLTGNNLCGSIPPSIGVLQSLTRLSFVSNAISEVAAEIGQLSRLSYLALSYNKIRYIPPQTGNLSSLQNLYFGANAIDTIPPELGNASNLLLLHLYDNNITSLPTELSRLSHLQSLRISGNRITSLPPELMGLTNLTNIRELPPQFGQLLNLVMLDLSNNTNLGPLPSQFANCGRLRSVYLPHTAIGSFPFLRNLTSLVELCLNDANITEVDFDGLTGLNDLELLDLSRNLLTTFNYTTLVDKPFLSTVDLSYNAIGGGLEWLNTYQDRLHFSVLNLAHNRIVAKFPFAKWSTVVDCNVAGSAGVPLSLTSLDLSYNNITCFSARVQTTSNSMLYYSAQRLSSLILSHCNLPPSADLSVIQEFMPRLEFVDFSSNPDVTADLSSFEPFEDLRSLRIEGTAIRASRLPRFLEVLPSTHHGVGHFSCFDVKSLGDGLVVPWSDAVFGYSLCQCDAGFYGHPPRCPECAGDSQICSGPGAWTFNATRDMLQTNRNTGTRLASRGFYAYPPPNATAMGSSTTFKETDYPMHFFACRDAGTSLSPCMTDVSSAKSNNGIYVQCTAGNEDFLCSKCSSGFFAESSGSCSECPDEVGRVFYAAAFAGLVVGIIVASMYSSASSGLGKTLMFLLPVLSAIDTPFPTAMRLLVREGGHAASLGTAGFECYFSGWSFVHAFLSGILGPVFLALICLAIYAAGRAAGALVRERADRKRSHQDPQVEMQPRRAVVVVSSTEDVTERPRGRHAPVASPGPHSSSSPLPPEVFEEGEKLQWGGRCARSALFLLNVQFFAFVTAALTPLTCADMDVLRMVNAPYQKCSTWMRSVAAIVFVLYGIGGPVALGVLVRRGVRSPKYQQFHAVFRWPAKYWELVLLLRRVAFLFVTLIVSSHSAFRAVGQCAVLALSALLHLWALPFKSSEENVCEMASLGLLAVNVVLSVSWRAAADAGRVDADACSLAVFALDACLVAYLALRIVWKGPLVRFVKSLWRRRTRGAFGGRALTESSPW